MDILNMKEFEDFKVWDSNTSKMLSGSIGNKRNFEIFEYYLGSFQSRNSYNSVSLGKKYNLTRTRILDIFYKYNIHFIIYLINIKNYKQDDSLILYLLSLLSKSGKVTVQEYLTDGRPSKYLTASYIKMIKNCSK